MRRSYKFIIGALALASFLAWTTASASITLKNSCTYSNTGTLATSSTCTLGTVTAGDFIVVVQDINSYGVTATMHDTGGDSFATSTQNVLNNGGSAYEMIWYAANVAGGASYVVSTTYSGSGTNYSSIAAFEYSGIATSSPLDGSAASTSAAVYTGTYSSGPATTTAAGDLLIAGSNCNNSAGAVSAGSGFTLLATSTVGNCPISEATTTGAAGSYSGVVTNNNSGQAIVVSIGLFKAQAAATSSGPLPYCRVISSDW